MIPRDWSKPCNPYPFQPTAGSVWAHLCIPGLACSSWQWRAWEERGSWNSHVLHRWFGILAYANFGEWFQRLQGRFKKSWNKDETSRLFTRTLNKPLTWALKIEMEPWPQKTLSWYKFGLYIQSQSTKHAIKRPWPVDDMCMCIGLIVREDMVEVLTCGCALWVDAQSSSKRKSKNNLFFSTRCIFDSCRKLSWFPISVQHMFPFS